MIYFRRKNISIFTSAADPPTCALHRNISNILFFWRIIKYFEILLIFTQFWYLEMRNEKCPCEGEGGWRVIETEAGSVRGQSEREGCQTPLISSGLESPKTATSNTRPTHYHQLRSSKIRVEMRYLLSVETVGDWTSEICFPGLCWTITVIWGLFCLTMNIFLPSC